MFVSLCGHHDEIFSKEQPKTPGAGRQWAPVLAKIIRDEAKATPSQACFLPYMTIHTNTTKEGGWEGAFIFNELH